MKKLGAILMIGVLMIVMAIPAFAQIDTPVNGGTVVLAGEPSQIT
ncbi:hypothetical protein SAMN02745912_02084 [Paramaledivibacter caminithermalis DSM 15212]|jgi:hypothetical protein|uniref:Uncharacterized protein n=1 Tax=Paramaledivibacter caminithermalis (strain DSM 15212 / CIP 107654 / DViRD3) TaxID=1121301 RepID=A0A1M6PAG9_PARC5|nr:hypothetical protein SAMN02745912_02084 [Paramaledivibacter caminithermalis DSM 15212]